MDSQKLKAIFIFAVATMLALWLGLNAATAQLETMLWVTGTGTLIICTLLGKKIWLIIPFLMSLHLTVNIPGQPNTTLIGQGLFVGFCGLLFLLKKLPLKIRFDELDIWTLLISLCAIQAYIRHPVGLNVFGGESVGAKPYALFAASLIASLILGNLKASHSDLWWIIRVHIIGGILNFVILGLGYLVPRFGVWIGSVNIESIGASHYQQGAYGYAAATRIQFVRDLGSNIALWVSSFKSPIKACFHPIWLPLVLLSFALAALSGYRNEIAAVGLTYFVGIAYRNGKFPLIFSSAGVVLAVCILAVVNLAAPLPANIQRSLSFLPGTWEEQYVEDAKNSTDWRVEMWEEALFTDYWIQNKWLGDGLGMTKKEHDYVQSYGWNQSKGAGVFRSGRLSVQQELMMATNNYHSGPVSTIRTVGYIGLVILLLAQIRLAVRAHRFIKRSRKTRWLPLALLIGIPVIWHPFFFVFVFGDYGLAITSYMMGAALLKIADYNTADDLPEIAHKQTSAHE